MEITKRYRKEQGNSFMKNGPLNSCNTSQIRVAMRKRGSGSTPLAFPVDDAVWRREGYTVCGGLAYSPSHPKSHWDILISLEHAALSVLLAQLTFQMAGCGAI